MADAFIGEIRIFAGNFPPKGWAFCDGSILSISQNTTLYSILGTTYGGDGKTTFALPNLRGTAPMGVGSGPGLTNRTLGQHVGSNTTTLLSNEMPAHTHVPQAINAPGNNSAPTGNYWAQTPPKGRGGVQDPIYTATTNTTMNPLMVSVQGGSQPHNNMQPFLSVNFIICLTDGMYPPHP